MITFDAADRSVCTARRQSTSTPLQALALLNDPQMVEASRHLGQRMLKEGGQVLDGADRLAVPAGDGPAGRSEKETTVLKRLHEEQRELFASDPQAAAKLLAVGESKNDPKLAKPDLAASAVLALTILNHDEAVMRR